MAIHIKERKCELAMRLEKGKHSETDTETEYIW